MRVTHVAPTTFGSSGLFGGGERYPLELARALAGRVDCRLLVFGPKTHMWKDPSGLQVIELRTQFLLRRHPAHPIAAGLFRFTGSADIIHTHHMRSAPSRTLALAAPRRGQTVVVTDHGLGGGDWGGLLQRRFDRFLVVSDFSARTLRAPENRTTPIYGGADPKRFRPGNDDGKDGVLFVGRITPHKGVDVLLRALPKNIPLTVAGTGGHDHVAPERQYPRYVGGLSAGKDVRFVGRAPERTLPDLYRRAGVFVLPSVHRTCFGRFIEVPELLGLSALEAMSSGTPVVCSSVGGVPEIVEHGVTGYLVEPGNEEELRQRIAELVSNRRLAQRMGSDARDSVLAKFTWEHCADRCLRVYSELVRRVPEYPPKATGDSHTLTVSASSSSSAIKRDSFE